MLIKGRIHVYWEYMKYLIAIGVLVVLGVGGYIGYQRLAAQPPPAVQTQENEGKTGVVTRTGVIQKLTKPGDDYTHMLRSEGGIIPLNSYTVTLDSYVNATVTVEGQFSGNTLFVDAVKE